MLSGEPNLAVLDMIDVYRNLATKLKLGLRWIYENVGANYILKIDDDAFVRVDSARDWLISRSS